MPEHLSLPEPRHLDSRRSSGGGSNQDQNRPERGSHGRRLNRELGAALSATPRVIVEGVDPRTVFKVKANTRLDIEPRGLQFLGDTADWSYFVVPVDENATKFREDLNEYQAGTGPGSLEKFFGNIETIERYGSGDRRDSGLPIIESTDAITVDVLLWPSGNQTEADRRLKDVEVVVDATRGEVIASDRRPLSTMVRARVSGEGLDALVELMVVELVRLPVVPFLEPSDWINATVGDLSVGDPLDVLVGVIDDGVQPRHPLLANLVKYQNGVPENFQWRDPGVHGSMVAGLAAYGDIEQALQEHLPLPSPALLAISRVLEPDPNDTEATRFPSDIPEHRVIEDAVRQLHDRGVRIINLSIAARDAYSGPHVSIWTETLDRLARELDILIVAAAGNRPIAQSGEVENGVNARDQYPTYALNPEARIAEPGVAANVVTVGSIARSAASARPGGRSDPRDIAIAQVNELSPFSRTGPGVNGTSQLGRSSPNLSIMGATLSGILWVFSTAKTLALR